MPSLSVIDRKATEEVEDVRKSARTQIPPFFDNDPYRSATSLIIKVVINTDLPKALKRDSIYNIDMLF